MSDALNSINLDQLTKTAMGGADTSWVQPTVAKLQKIEKDKEAAQQPALEQIKTDATKDRKEVDTKYAGIEPVDLPKWDAAKEAAKRQTDPIQAFGSFGSVFAIAASAFTHTPIINALNGSAAAMQAIKKKDEDGYNQAYDAWKENTKIALDRHNLQHQDYEDAFDKMKVDMAEGQAMLTVTAAKYGDQAASLMNEAGLYEKLGSLQEARANSARGLLTVMPDLQRKNLEVQSAFALTNAQKELNAAQASGDPTKIVQAQLGLQTAQQQIKNVHEAFNPYATGASGTKNVIGELQLKAIDEKVAALEQDKGRAATAGERLSIANDVMSSGKTGSSFDAQLLADYRRDYSAMNDGKAPSAAEEAAFKLESKNLKPDLPQDTLDEMSEQYLAGDGTIFQNLGRGQQGAANIVALRNNITRIMNEQGISPEDQAFQMQAFKALGATLRTVGTTQGKISLGRKELDVLIPQALAASKELPRSNYPTANAVQLAVEAGTGDPKVRKLAIALQAVKSAYSQVLVRGGASTDAARAQTDDLFQSKDPQAVIEIAMGQIRAESDAVAHAPGAVMEEERGTFGRKKRVEPAGTAAPAAKADDFSHLWEK